MVWFWYKHLYITFGCDYVSVTFTVFRIQNEQQIVGVGTVGLRNGEKG